MRYKLSFGLGFAAGYVLGARAGRSRYDAILRSIRDLKDNSSFQETAGVLQAQASSAIDTAKKVVTEKVTSRVGGHDVTAEVTTPMTTPVASAPTPYPPPDSPFDGDGPRS